MVEAAEHDEEDDQRQVELEPQARSARAARQLVLSRRGRSAPRTARPACGSARRASCRMLLTCVFTVFSPITSSRAISLFALPWARSLQHVVLALGQGCGVGISGVRTSRIRRAAAAGESWTWPAAAALIAAAQLVGLRVLQQIADGARLHGADHGAVFKHAREGDDLRVRQLARGSLPVAVMPSITGMSMSMSTTSGFSSGAASRLRRRLRPRPRSRAPGRGRGTCAVPDARRCGHRR